MNFGTKSFQLDRYIPKANMRLLLRPSQSKGSTRYFTLPLLENEENIIVDDMEVDIDIVQEQDMFNMSMDQSHEMSDISIEEGEITPQFKSTIPLDTPSDIYDIDTGDIAPMNIVIEPMDIIAQIEQIDNKITHLTSPKLEFKTKQKVAAQMTFEKVTYSHPLLSIFESSFHILTPKEQEIALNVLKKELSISSKDLLLDPIIPDLAIDSAINSVSKLDTTPISIDLKPTDPSEPPQVKAPMARDTISQEIKQDYQKSLDLFIFSYIAHNHELESNHHINSAVSYLDSYKSYTPTQIDLPDIEASGPRLQNTQSDAEFQEILNKIQLISQWDDPNKIKESSATIPTQKYKSKSFSFPLLPSCPPIKDFGSFSEFVKTYKQPYHATASRKDPYMLRDPLAFHQAHLASIMQKYPNITSRFVQAYQEHHKNFEAIAQSLSITRREAVQLFYLLKYKYPALRKKNVEKPRVQIKWTEQEREIAFNAFDEHGKDFHLIAELINKNNPTPKNEQHVRTFFYNSRRKREESIKTTPQDNTESPTMQVDILKDSIEKPKLITVPYVPKTIKSPLLNPLKKKFKSKELIDLEEQRLSSNINEIKKRSPDELLRTQFDYANANLLRRASLQQRFQPGQVPREKLPEMLSQLRHSMETQPQVAAPTIAPAQQEIDLGFSKEGQLPSFDSLERKVNQTSSLENYLQQKTELEKKK